MAVLEPTGQGHRTLVTPVRVEARIGGRWVGSDTRFAVRDPFSGQVLAEVADLGRAEAMAAVAAAQAAFPAWAAQPAKVRGHTLRRWYDLIVRDQERLARLITLESGKPLTEARGEVAYGAAFVEWFSEEAKRAYGRTIPTTDPGKRLLTTKRPIGVCAAITPWNFPLAMITRKAAPALAAGNTMVLKPAAQTPLTALALVELSVEAGVPDGVLNIVTSLAPDEVGDVFCEHPSIRKFSFTGSTKVGKALGARCVASNVKRLSLELGGNAPLIIFADADIDHAVHQTLIAKFRNAGQTCVCANRILVDARIHDAFAAKLSQAVAALGVGNGLDPDVAIGPLIDQAAMRKVGGLVAQAVEAGASVLTGGAPHPAGDLCYAPTVLIGVTPDMAISREEVFGPVAPITMFENEGEAVTLANDTDYGLAAYVFTRDIHRVWRMSEGLEFGMVSLNDGLLSTEVAPFGGVKQSGVGREGGAEGLEDYLETQYLNLGGFCPADLS